jgi:hypothetical protein
MGNLGEGSVDATYEGAYQRADGTWCVKRQSSHDPQVDIPSPRWADYRLSE